MTSLVVPMEVKAFRCPETRKDVALPLADFTGLPWTRVQDGRGVDQNADTPYTSRDVLRDPFSVNTGVMERGIHLHWHLPRTLVTGHQIKSTDKDSTDRLVFPTVPNRWLVRRYGEGIPTRKWIVFSDFAWPADETPPSGTISFPNQVRYGPTAAKAGLVDPKVQPYRFLGRVWDPRNEPWPQGADSPPKLTALGYGEPAFASFYPSCRNIFTMHDECEDMPESLAASPPEDLRYEIIGLYSEHDDDPVVQLQNGTWILQQDPSQRELDDASTTPAPDLATRIKEAFSWSVDSRIKSLDGMICFAQVRFDGADKGKPRGKPSIAFGNTGTEALSAHIAKEIVLNQDVADYGAGGHALALASCEHQLEAINLMDATRGHRIDLGPKFKEARHTKGFNPQHGGKIWTLRLVVKNPILGRASDQSKVDALHKMASKHDVTTPTPKAAPADTGGVGHGQSHAQLPRSLARELHKLNVLQGDFDRQTDTLADLRKLIHLQWQKYIHCSYYSDIDSSGYPSSDAVKTHVEGLIVLLQAKSQYVGALSPDHVDDHRRQTKAAAALLGYLDTPETAKIIPASLVDDRLVDWCRQVIASTGASQSLVVQLAQQAGYLRSALEYVASVTAKSRVLGQMLKASDDPEKGAAEKTVRATRDLCDAIASIEPFPELRAELGGVAHASGARAIPSGVFAQTDHAAAIVMSGEKLLLQPLKRAVASLNRLPLLELASIAAPRYWQPNDPVLNLSNHAAYDREPASRLSDPAIYDADGKLVCQVAADVGAQQLDGHSSVETLWQDLDARLSTWTKTGWGVTTIAPNSAPHLFFEWDMQVNPLEGNSVPSRRRLDKNFVLRHFHLQENRIEFLSERQTVPPVTSGITALRGRSLLSGHSPIILKLQIDRYLANLIRDFIKANPQIAPEHEARKGYDAGLAKVDADPVKREAWIDRICDDKVVLGQWITWTEDQQNAALSKIGGTLASPVPSPIRAVVAARRKLSDADGATQAHALTGFNEYLMMQEQVLQFDPIDPLGFDDDRDFTETLVRSATRGHGHSAPLPFADFHPIRTGAAHLRKLQLIDSFGVITPIAPDDSATSSQQFGTAQEARIKLPPRITQPARLQFRWVSADLDTIESNAHPVTSPVAGWITCNNLELSLMIYDRNGALLGSVDQTGRWRAVPDQRGIGHTGEIENPHLRQTIDWIVAKAKDETDFVSRYIDLLEAALEKIDPEDFEHHQASALFISRPMALVRASVNLEIKGLPAYNHSWDALHQVLAGNDLNDDGYRDVKFPIRIGEHGQLNDGVAGLWVNDSESAGASRFLSPQLDMGALLGEGKADEGAQLAIQIGGDPSFVTLLMDPRGSAHCTSGILPTKELRLPQEHYQHSLRAIRPQFLTAPVLTQGTKVEIPLAKQPGWSWDWVHASGQDWSRHSTISTLEYHDLFAARGHEAEQDWMDLLDSGWLRSVPDQEHRAHVVPLDQRGDLEDASEAYVTFAGIDTNTSVKVDVSGGDGDFTVDLSALKEGQVTSHLTIIDAAGQEVDLTELEHQPRLHHADEATADRASFAFTLTGLNLPQPREAVLKRLLTTLPKMLKPTTTQASFGPKSVLREGWLQLTPEPDDSGPPPNKPKETS